MKAPEIIEQPAHAKSLIVGAGGVTAETAERILVALAKAGYVVAPLEPTNSMLEAYIAALGMPASNYRSVIWNVGKARRRWKAMAAAGMKIAFSDFALVAQLDEQRNSTPMDAGSSPAERATSS